MPATGNLEKSPMGCIIAALGFQARPRGAPGARGWAGDGRVVIPHGSERRYDRFVEWQTVALVALALSAVAFFNKLRVGFAMFLLFLVLGLASGLLPPLNVVAGAGEDQTTLSLGSGEAFDDQDDVTLGNCVWQRNREVQGEPAPAAAVFSVRNNTSTPMKVRVEVIFGRAVTPQVDALPIFVEIHDWTPAPSERAHWLLPPLLSPLTEPNNLDQPVEPVALMPPVGVENDLISWCEVRIADLRDA